MSDRINKFKSGKVYTMKNNKTNILNDYIQMFIKDVTSYRQLIIPNINDFGVNAHINQLFEQYDVVSSRHNKVAEDITIELKRLDKHGCIHYTKPINTQKLDLLRSELNDTYELMRDILIELYD